MILNEGEAPYGQTSIRSVLLDSIKLGIERRVSAAVAQNGDLRMITDFMTNDIIMSFRTNILAERMGTVEAKWPCDWIEALKERFAPRWALRRWPVVYSTKKWNAMALYPDFVPSVPNQKTVQVFTQVFGDLERD